ncbi:galactosylceramide sulfotransferase-like isoform X2 [Branchiostoma lanceolatum]|uniref:galactosylceramide sulfotransferase-like isoform X2 n=1 Tax=Branchiostoma lanceolatum TaxID=7740 RepID=UPI00345343CD
MWANRFELFDVQIFNNRGGGCMKGHFFRVELIQINICQLEFCMMQLSRGNAVFIPVFALGAALLHIHRNDWVVSRPPPKRNVSLTTMMTTKNITAKSNEKNMTNSTEVGKRSSQSDDGHVYLGSSSNISKSISNNKLPSNVICKPHLNVAFMKVHKCGSTTLSNVIYRFGYKYKLIVALPPTRDRSTIGSLGTIKDSDYKHPPGGKLWNIFAHHAMYNRTRFHQLMAPDTRYVTILREPLRRLQSAFKYFHLQRRFPGLKEQTRHGTSPVVTYLTRPQYWDPLYRQPIGNKEHYCFRNCMARDLGLKEKDYDNHTAVQEFVQGIENDFTTVLILEYLSESLVLLKRRMCWTFHDILYTYGRSSRKQRYKRNPPITGAMKDRFYNRNYADVLLYTRFKESLQRQIKEGGAKFRKEVKHFKRVNKHVGRYCNSKKKKRPGKMVVPKSRWNGAFSVDRPFCGRYGKSRKYWHQRLQSAYH